jgi:hypothetical protein
VKNRHILVVAKDSREGRKYVKRADLPNFTYRIVRAAASIQGIQSVDVHLVDGFEQRPDAGSILAQLRWGRDIVYYSVAMPEALEAPATDQGDGMGEQLTIDDVAPVEQPKPRRRHKSVDPVIEIVPAQSAAESPDHVVATSDDAAELTEQAKPRARRSRCKTCGRLTLASYDVDKVDHDIAAHTTGGFF